MSAQIIRMTKIGVYVLSFMAVCVSVVFADDPGVSDHEEEDEHLKAQVHQMEKGVKC